MRAERWARHLRPAENKVTTGELLSGLAVLAGLTLLLTIILGLPPVLSAAGASRSRETEGAAVLHLVESNRQRVVLELNTPSYAIESSTTDSAHSHLIRVPGLTIDHQAGKPALPMKAALLGIPPGVEVAVEVLEVETEVLPGRYWLSAAPRPVVREDHRGWPDLVGYSLDKDPTVYQKSSLYPVEMAQAEPLGHVRNQRVARVVLYPFQFNPAAGQLVYHRRIKVAVNFVGTVRPDASLTRFAAAGSFEQALAHTLVNYSSARLWRSAAPPSVNPVVATPRAGELSCKITVQREGIYRITHADLQEAGCAIDDVDPRLLRMYNQGKEVAIQVGGENDGAFDPGDVLRFYGQGIDSKYTKKNVYWLGAEASPAARMPIVDGRPKDPVPAAGPFLATVRAEEDHVYWAAPTPSSGRDYWFWERLYATPTKVDAKEHTIDLPFQADGVFTTTLRVAVKSRYDQASQDPDHHLEIYLNDTLVAEPTWDGEKVQVVTIHEPQSILRQGSNTLRLVAPCDLGAPFDVVYLDWFEVDYYRTHGTDADELAFANTHAGLQRFAVRGFSESKIELYDVSQPATVSRIISTTVSSEGDTYTLEFQAAATSPRRYVALAENRLSKPADIAVSRPPALPTPAMARIM